MPEGPEVRKYADALDHVLTGRVISSLEARTRDAKEWLRTNEKRVVGQQVTSVISHGKHLIGYLNGGFFFHSHLMMWGRWQTFGPVPKTKRSQSSGPFSLPEKDRRERARIVVEGGAAILLSAPIFNLRKGDPYKRIENLQTLGPDILPYDRGFDDAEFKHRLFRREYLQLPIGAALLNQRIVAGLGNYLRAEVLFACKLDPWQPVADLSERDLDCLIRTIPKLAWRAYKQTATAGKGDRKKMTNDPTLVYQPGREYGTRHLVFRRTNLPCLRCGEKVKQLRQKTYNTEPAEKAEERTRIVYFCPKCQKVDLEAIKQK